MDTVEYRHGALSVVETVRDRDFVQRELRKIDDRLFVEKQLTYTGEAVWCVVVSVGGDVPPLTLLEHRDPSGRPLELSGSLIDRAARMERDGARLSAKVIRQNAARLEDGRKRMVEQLTNLGEDGDRFMNAGHSALLHRGQHLRRSRDKRRAQGDKI